MAKTKQGAITKQEAVRRALEEKGKDARPVDLKPYIKETFGFDMTTKHITTSKSKILKAARKGKRGAKKKQAPKAPLQPAPQQAAAPRASDGRSGISLEDIQAVKGLIGRVGARPLQTL